MTAKNRATVPSTTNNQTTTAKPSANPANSLMKLADQTAEATATGIKFAKPKAEKAKSDRPFCDHIGKGDVRCQLRVMEGFEQCVNHVPAESKLTQHEAEVLELMVTEMTSEQRIRLLARTLGWYKCKLLVSGKPEGDVLLNELVG